MNDRDIESNVHIIIGHLLGKKQITKDEQVFLAAISELVINLLQNINEIAEQGRR